MKRFIPLISSVFIICNCTALPSYASSGTQKVTIDGVQYTYTDNGNNITINSIDTSGDTVVIPSVIDDKAVVALADKVCSDNSAIKTVKLPYTITSIGNNAFESCTNLQSINIPDGIQSIGELCFAECRSLISVNLPDSIKSAGDHCFAYCSSLKEAVIPAGITEIPWGMYANCTALSSVSIPDNADKIGISAFGGCRSLSDIKWDLTADSVASNAFTGTPWLENNSSEFLLLNDGRLLLAYNGSSKNAVIPDGVTEIADSAFENNTVLETIKIPDSVTGIADMMFSGCSSLKNVDLPDNLQYIGSGAFGECKSLTDINIPDSVTNIKEKAFYMCESLKTVHLPSSLETLGRLAFGKCTSLKTVNIPNGICASIDHTVFNEATLENVTIGGKMTTQLSEALNNGGWTGGDEEFVIVDGILTNYNGSDKEIVIPDTVKEIGADVFMGKDIIRVTLPKSLTKIGASAFYGIKGLIDIVIPGGVTEIDSMAFAECTNLKNITFEESNISITLGNSSFQSVAVTEDTLITNERTILNKDTAFTNTALANNKTPATDTPVLTEPEKVIEVTSNENGISIKADSKKIEFNDAQPFIDENERTQIPIRAVAETLGAKVDWNNESQTAVITKGDNVITITIGKPDILANGKTITMDTVAQIINDRTYIPIRFVGEALGMTVNWAGE